MQWERESLDALVKGEDWAWIHLLSYITGFSIRLVRRYRIDGVVLRGEVLVEILRKDMRAVRTCSVPGSFPGVVRRIVCRIGYRLKKEADARGVAVMCATDLGYDHTLFDGFEGSEPAPGIPVPAPVDFDLDVVLEEHVRPYVTPARYEIVRLRVLGRLTWPEAARAIGGSVGGVKRAFQEAMRTLRRRREAKAGAFECTPLPT